jgi:hypothetical protein
MATENKAPKTDWLVGHLDYIRGLKSPTDAQKLLIFLSDKKDLTPSDQKKLDLIAKVERDFEKAKAGRWLSLQCLLEIKNLRMRLLEKPETMN